MNCVDSQRKGNSFKELADLSVSLTKLGFRMTVSFSWSSILFFYVGEFSLRQSLTLAFMFAMVTTAVRNSRRVANPRQYRVIFQPAWRDVFIKHGLIDASDNAWKKLLNEQQSDSEREGGPKWMTATFTVLGPELVYHGEYARFARSMNFRYPIHTGERNEASGTPYWYGRWRRDGLWRDREFSIGIVTSGDAGEIELAVVPWLFFQQTRGPGVFNSFVETRFRKLDAAMSKSRWEPAKYSSYDWQHPMMSIRFEELL